MVFYDCVLNKLTLKSHRNVSEEPRIRSQKLHCRCFVYLDALLKKLQKVAEIAYMSSTLNIKYNHTAMARSRHHTKANRWLSAKLL